MSSDQREVHFNLVLRHEGFHPAAWRLPTGRPELLTDIDHTFEICRLAERGLFDSIFVGDTPVVVTEAAHFTAPLEPMTLMAAIATATERIGVIGSISTTYTEPYNAARQLAALDHISKGRAGWNVVTTKVPEAAANFGQTYYPSHTERYERQNEFHDVVLRLFDSWAPDALVGDKDAGVFVDPKKIRPVDYHGEYISVQGALNIARPVQGHPLIVQAGSSEEGMDFAARAANAIFTSQPSIEEARKFYHAQKSRLAAHGRRPEELTILPGLAFTLGSTEEEAARVFDYRNEHMGIEYAYDNVSRALEIDLSGYDIDDLIPVDKVKPPEEVEVGRSRHELILNMVRREKMTIRDLGRWMLGSGVGHRHFYGTPEQLADEIELWGTTGGSDGFSLMPSVTMIELPIFVDEVVPLLQKRGLFRHEYTSNTLRGHFGLDPVAPPVTW